MSFILDALKKSEADRQQQSGAAVSYVPAASRTGGTPRALLVVTGLLAGTVVVLLFILLRSQQSTGNVQQATVPEPRIPVATDQQPASATSSSSGNSFSSGRVNDPVLTTENAIAEALPATPPAGSSATAPAAANATPVAAPAVAAATEPVEPVLKTAEKSPPPADNETYLTFNDLRATGKLGLPDMHIDLHVFSDKPAERFVFINMNQYRENATLTEGPRLRQIREDGVLLEYVGTTFLLPRE